MDKSKLFKQPQIAPGVLPGVKAEDLPTVKCVCGGEIFVDACSLMFASSFQSSTGIPTIVKNPKGFLCRKCGNINRFDTKELPISKGDKEIIFPKKEGKDNGD